MPAYAHNPTWLVRLAPFRAMSISAAYLTPFFLEKGLSLGEILVLQSVFSAALILLELPSGYVADRLGRAWCIKASAPIATIALIAYGFCGEYWQFVLAELALAVANSLISGADTALLVDSLKAAGRETEYVQWQRRIDGWVYGATAVGVPVSMGLAHYISISATLVADGVLMIAGTLIAFRLTEAPHVTDQPQSAPVGRTLLELTRNRELRWLVLLGTVLTTATWLAFWLSAPYYQSLGIPVVLFSGILALRSLWKTSLAHGWWRRPAWLPRWRPMTERPLHQRMAGHVFLAAGVYLGMAAGQLWLVWLVLGHDIVQALHSQPLTDRVNRHIAADLRATSNSAINLVRRVAYTVIGPAAGLVVDRAGLRTGLLVAGLGFGLLGWLALNRLGRHTTVAEAAP